MTMRITPLGHSCVLVETEGADGARVRLLLDPGSLAPQLDPIEGLDAILITHAHGDHLDAEQVRRVRGTGSAPLYGDAESMRVAAEAGLEDVHPVEPGSIRIAGVDVEVSAWTHEQIYPGVPLPQDYGYLIGGRVFAPGDAFAVPESPVDLLLLPTGAPWMKLSETIDYLRQVAPDAALPVHDGGLAPAHQQMHRALIGKFAPEGTAVLVPTRGEAIDLH
ncbi:MBL fold metallo-hydrolase [Microbacterium sp.]|uniref:MBL fold metallo-hydrolase n=1 Tax=Microbacterium sp. TaxID=51671 RepID=UPI0039E261B7